MRWPCGSALGRTRQEPSLCVCSTLYELSSVEVQRRDCLHFRGGIASSHHGTVRNPSVTRQVFSLSSGADCSSVRSESVGGIADASGSPVTTYRPASHPSRSANRQRLEQNGRWGFSLQVVCRPHIGQRTVRPSRLMTTPPRRCLACAGESPRWLESTHP